MKRAFARMTAGFLAFLMALGLAPDLTVYASTQQAVADLTVSNPGKQGSNYALTLTWTQATYPTTDANITDKGLNLVWRNTSTNQTYTAASAMSAQSRLGLDEALSRYAFGSEGNAALQLTAGSIYGFKPFPYHIHTVTTTTGTSYTTHNVAYTNTTDEALYLTDITTEASAATTDGVSYLTVKWDNPRYNNQSVFDGYYIYYEKTPTGTMSYANPKIWVAVNDCAPSNSAAAEYTFPAELAANTSYSVKVEPTYNNKRLFRTTGGVTGITLSSAAYDVAYPPIDKTEYRYDGVYSRIGLTVADAGPDNVRLEWDSLAEAFTSDPVARVEIYRSPEIDENGNLVEGAGFELVGTVGSTAITQWITEKPFISMYYQLYIFLKSDLEAQPETPSNFSNAALYDPSHEEFYPYAPNILNADYLPKEAADSYSLDVIWRAFTRKAYTEEELEAADSVYGFIDKDVIYDIWISDNLNNLKNDNFEPNYSYLAYDLTLVRDVADPLNASNMLLGYKPSSSFTQYTDANGQVLSFTGNNVYYIKIVARRDPGGEESQYAYYAIYIPAFGDIAPNPNMMGKTPLRVKTDENGVELITQESITVAWYETWFEVYNPYADEDGVYVNNWFSRIGVKDGQFVFGDDADPIKHTDVEAFNLNGLPPLYEKPGFATAEEARAAFLDFASGVADASLIAFRKMDLRDGDTGREHLYEIHVVVYDKMVADGGTYEDYVNKLIDNAAMWSDGGSIGDLERLVDSLDKNTAYVIFFRPYFMVGGERRVAYYPNYVTATTLDTHADLAIKPTVPVLTVTGTTDTTVTLWWPYTTGFTYALKWAEQLAQYPDGGTQIGWDAINPDGTGDGKGKWVTGTDAQGNEVQGIEYTVTGLFPDTDHYFWLKAFSGELDSEWSSPANGKTLDIEAPDPPRGLGLASDENVKQYNNESGADYVPSLSSKENVYMIVEWMRDYMDLNNPDPDQNTTSGTGAGDASAEFLAMTQQLLSTYMVKFNELTANRAYYIRAKTVLTITQGTDGIVRSYHYVVQISPTDTFTDYVEMTVPSALPVVTSGVKMKQKESVWSETVRLSTERAVPPEGDYDGDKNPITYPVPDQDFELTYNRETQTLTYRFRSNKLGTDGLKDNQADQRFISRLVQDRTYTFNIDMTGQYYNGGPISTRVVEMPYSIFSAFEERKISLRVQSGDTTVTLSPGALNTAEARTLSGRGSGASVKLTLKLNASGAPVLPAGMSYATEPQQLVAQMVTPGRTVEVKNFAKPVKVDMKLNNQFIYTWNNVGAYQSDKNTAGWQLVASTLNTATGVRSMETNKAAHYTTVTQSGPAGSPANPYYSAMLTVTSRVNITDMPVFTPDDAVSAVAFNNLVAAIAYDRHSVAMNGGLADTDYLSLGKSKLLVSGVYVPKEAGITAVVKLYELKTKSVVKDAPDLGAASVAGIGEADPQYQAALLKADALGMLDDPAMNPKDNMTVGQLMYLLSVVIEDAGL